jgi:CO/xanthine dehydrogenase FAD-binding subunit
MTLSLFDGAIGKLVYALATAAVLGGGSTVLTNWKTNGEQDIRIIRLEQLDEKLDETNKNLAEVDRELGILNERLRNRND